MGVQTRLDPVARARELAAEIAAAADEIEHTRRIPEVLLVPSTAVEFTKYFFQRWWSSVLIPLGSLLICLLPLIILLPSIVEASRR
jgi:hypothetical protein